MSMALLLPWFPIILATGVAGHFAGRTRGLGIGFFCALFYVALVQATVGVRLWHDGWALFGTLAGAFAIAGMGGWSGQSNSVSRARSWRSREPRNASDAAVENAAGDSTELKACDATRIHALLTRFDEWLENNRECANPWPEFGEFIRRELRTCVRATHAKLFRLQNDGDELVALNDFGSLSGPERLSARHGLPGRVLATGRSYVAEVDGGSEFKSVAEPIAWCIPVLRGSRRLGLLTVGHLGTPPGSGRAMLQAVESLISEFWGSLSEVLAGRAAVQRDPVSGLMTRPAFFRAAERAITASYHAEEPVAVAMVALEGMRDLNDIGRWESADALVDEAGRALGSKLRAEDCLGRFDGSRFVLLLRRVDADLASLIVGQIVGRLTAICGDAERWGSRVQVRCGVGCSGSERPSLNLLVDRALKQNSRARKEGSRIALDRADAAEPVEASL